MNKTLRLALFFLVLPFLLPATGFAYWEWTPETGRWTHSWFSVRETPEEQYDWAEEFIARGEYGTAVRKLRQLVRAFSGSPMVPKARLRIAETFEAAGEYRRAYDAYQELLEKNPGTGEAGLAIERQFALAPRLIGMSTGGRLSFLPGSEFFAPDPGERILASIETAPHASQAEQALFELGMHYFQRRRYRESTDIFDRLARDYSRGEYPERARFQAALATRELGAVQPNNREALLSAYQRLEDYLARYPEGENRAAAVDLREQVREDLAGLTLEIARFYGRTGNSQAAQLYYRRVVDDYPGTAAAREAAKNLP